MGAVLVCPAGFEAGKGLSCHVQCPAEFKYIQELGTGGEKCVHNIRSNRSVQLQAIPKYDNKAQPPPQFANERKRFADELAKVKVKIAEDDETDKVLKEFTAQSASRGQEYGKIQSDYAVYNTAANASKDMKDITSALKPKRPPTSPASDIEQERRAILAVSNKKMLFIQIALFLVVLSMLIYLFVPSDYAHSMVFLLLCVGISSGFFLRG